MVKVAWMLITSVYSFAFGGGLWPRENIRDNYCQLKVHHGGFCRCAALSSFLSFKLSFIEC